MLKTKERFPHYALDYFKRRQSLHLQRDDYVPLVSGIVRPFVVCIFILRSPSKWRLPVRQHVRQTTARRRHGPAILGSADWTPKPLRFRVQNEPFRTQKPRLCPNQCQQVMNLRLINLSLPFKKRNTSLHSEELQSMRTRRTYTSCSTVLACFHIQTLRGR